MTQAGAAPALETHPMKHVHFPQFGDKDALKRVEADLIICWGADWEARPERHDPSWVVVRDEAKLFF
jgi:hypothetical protein